MSGKDIAKAFKSASRSAGDRAKANGHSVVLKRGRKIVRRSPEGIEQVVRTLDKAFVRAGSKTFKVK